MTASPAKLPEPSIQQIEAQFATFLQQRSLPFTAQRRQILRGIFEHRERFTADGLWKAILEKDKSASRSTIFRTITLLKDCDLIREVEVARGQRFYYPKTTNHEDPNHLICSDCGKVIEFQDEHMALLEECITRRLGFKSNRKTLRIDATCEELRLKGFCERATSQVETTPSPQE